MMRQNGPRGQSSRPAEGALVTPRAGAASSVRYRRSGRREKAMTETERPEIGQTADAGGIKTNYLEAGEGPAVVLIHGSGPGVTSYANWRLVIPALAEDFRVLAPDMVGFGFTDRPSGVEYGVQTWADQVVGLMDSLGIERASLVGNSFGGAIALR